MTQVGIVQKVGINSQFLSWQWVNAQCCLTPSCAKHFSNLCKAEDHQAKKTVDSKRYLGQNGMDGTETSGCDKLSGYQINRQSRELNSIQLMPTNREKIFCGTYFEYKSSLICYPLVSDFKSSVCSCRNELQALTSAQLLVAWHDEQVGPPALPHSPVPSSGTILIPCVTLRRGVPCAGE